MQPEGIKMSLDRCYQPVPLILVKNDEFFLPYALDCIKGKFNKYVIYDIGSDDLTKDIIEDFIAEEQAHADIFYRFLPDCPPVVQGALRNSMFAEARADWVFILDADEVYNPEDIVKIQHAATKMQVEYEASSGNKIYGVFRRREFSADLRSSYSDLRGHHRLYHRTAIFNGPHPGEWPLVSQNHNNEVWFDDILCYHFHNALRSSLGDTAAPKRQERKPKATYHPGRPEEFDLLKALPRLRESIDDYPVCPALAVLQKEAASD
jgi:glycosyltransferase involved in cell wall biosynthesis